MKRKQMDSVARSMCEVLMSRNNDIAGYWGIGFLCRTAKQKKRNKIAFRIQPGQTTRIDGYEILDSFLITEKLMKHDLDMIQGRLSFFADGRYPNGSDKYTCGIAIAVTQDGRTGMHISLVECWPHDSSLESRSTRFKPHEVNKSDGILEKIKRLIK